MICTSCARAADGFEPDFRQPHCRYCDRLIAVYRTDVPEAEQRICRHKWQGWKCDGSGRPPVYVPVGWGHAKCKGCDCQHRSIT